MSATLAFALATSEMALVIVPIFAVYLYYRTGRELLAQAAAPDSTDPAARTHYEVFGVAPDANAREIRAAHQRLLVANGAALDQNLLAGAVRTLSSPRLRHAYDRRLARDRAAAESAAPPHVGLGTRVLLFAGAGAIAALWPFAGSLRRKLRLVRLPDAASPLLVITLLTLPFFGPLVEKLPFVEDRGFDGQSPVYTPGSAPVVTPGGELPVMLITLGVLFAAAAVVGIAWRWHVFVICWAMFYGITITMFTGFFTNRGGVWTGLWGTLDYWWRPEAKHVDGPAYFYAMTLPAYEIVPIAVAAAALVALMIRSPWRERAIVAAACLMIAAIIGAPAWLRPVADHRMLLLLITGAGAVLTLRVPDLTKFLAFWALAAFFAFSTLGRKDAALGVHIALPLALLAAKLVGDAVASFEMPRVAMPEASWRRRTMPRAIAQGAVLAAFGAAVVSSARSGVLASWGHGSAPRNVAALSTGDHGDAPTELLHPDDIAPDVQAVRAAIARAGADSGQGANIPIAVDTSYDFAKGWLWYLRDYPNLAIEDMRHGYQAPPGAIVLFDSRNRAKVQVSDASVSLAFASKWSIGGGAELTRGEVASDLTSGAWWRRWSGYLLDHEDASTPEVMQGVAYFPDTLSAALPRGLQSEVLASSVQPQLQGPPAP